MDIHPEVSNGVIDPLTGIPSQTTTEVTTRMIVPDGRTIFVGGLIKHRIEEGRHGIPIGNRIPGVGRLFSSRENNKTNTETIVLITSTLLAASDNGVDQDTLDMFEQMDERQLSDKQLLNDEMELFFGTH